MAAVGLALPVGIGAIRLIKTFKRAGGALADAGKVANRLEGAGDAAQAAARADNVGDFPEGTSAFSKRADRQSTLGANVAQGDAGEAAAKRMFEDMGFEVRRLKASNQIQTPFRSPAR